MSLRSNIGVNRPPIPIGRKKPAFTLGFGAKSTRMPRKTCWRSPENNARWVRKGIKAGLVSEIETDPSRLYHIYAVSVRNLGTPVYPRRYFDHLLRVFGEDLDIVTITKDGHAVASVLNFYFRDQVLPYYGGGLTEARSLAANDFMYWEVLRRAGERGYRLFDFGRSKKGTGAYSFKKNWGFEPEPWTYEYYLRKGGEIPEINPLNPKYRYFIAGWKRMPVGLAKRLGPLIVRGIS